MEVTWHSPNSPKINDKVIIVLEPHICSVDNISYIILKTWNSPNYPEINDKVGLVLLPQEGHTIGNLLFGS